MPTSSNKLFTVATFVLILLAFQISIAQVGKRKVSLEWEKIQQAENYEIEIADKNKNRMFLKVSESELTVIELSPGEYYFRIRAKDKRGIAGTWSGYELLSVKVGVVRLLEPANNKEKIVLNADTISIDFKWSPASGAEKYLLKIFSKQNSFNKELVLHDNFITVELPVGDNYKWSVQSFTGSEYSPMSESEFTILGKNYAKPKIEKPKNAFVRRIQWHTESYSDAVDVLIWKLDFEKQNWVKVYENLNQKTNQFDFPFDWQGGEYRIEVLAKKDSIPISEKEILTFSVKNGDRSIASENKAMVEELFKRQKIKSYFVNYVASQIVYGTKTPYLNSESTFSALTGAVSIGGDALFSKYYGLRGQLTFGNMSINKKQNLIKRLELETLYRSVVSDVSDSRVFFGMYYNELPETHISLSGTKNDIQISSATGLLMGFDYWQAIYGVWGAKGILTYALPITGKSGFGSNFKNGNELILGILGSYRYEKEKLFSFGYKYKSEKYQYSSAKENYQDNEITLSGHFFSFDYSWEFE
jgi:hypothetical protein